MSGIGFREDGSNVLREIAHCKLCMEPMLYIYSHVKRNYCHDCIEGLKASGWIVTPDGFKK